MSTVEAEAGGSAAVTVTRGGGTSSDYTLAPETLTFGLRETTRV
jgi:hypothetical protein